MSAIEYLRASKQNGCRWDYSHLFLVEKHILIIKMYNVQVLII